MDACRYPPSGTRSYGPTRAATVYGSDYFSRANDDVMVFAMIETAAGLDAVDEICAVEGLTGIYVGPSDLGLALALAGEPQRGVGVLVNAVRSSDVATPKLRQNLAYAYALAGNWRAARVMAAEDVPADQLEARLAQWARMSAPAAPTWRAASRCGR